MPVVPGLWLGGDFDDIRACLAEGVAPGDIRFFIGYSGWTAGQLDMEVERNSWYVHDLPLERKKELVLNPEPGNLWQSMLQEKGPGFARVTELPANPNLN